MRKASLEAAFLSGATGKLRLTDCVVDYTGGLPVLTVAGFHDDGLPFAMTTAPFAGNPSLRAMQAAYDIAKSHTTLPPEPSPIRAFRKTIAMGKLHQIAARAPQVVKELEARADKLGTRLDALDKHGNATFDKWDSHVTDQESAITDAEDAINQLSNGAGS